MLGALFTDPSGNMIDIPGFYNGNNEWIVRFCPNKIGRWRYITYSTLHEFSGVEGEVIAAENINRKVHGPIVISKMDKQKFQYSDGTPYFMMAFELDWLFALDAENKDDIPRTKEIISEIAKKGFNQIEMNV